jgi:uncharacterized cupredoxin-like copper-binding protein
MAMKKLLVLLFAAAFLTAGCGGSNNEESAGGGNTTTSESTTTSEGGAAPIKKIVISETEFKLDPSSVKLDKPGTYVFEAKNNGSVEHALEIEGQGVEEETSTLGPGEEAEVRVTLTKAGSYEMYCPISNHRDQGMEGTVTLGGGGSGTTTGEDNMKTETESETETSGGGNGGY